MTAGGNDRASVYSSAEKLKQPDAMFDGEFGRPLLPAEDGY